MDKRGRYSKGLERREEILRAAFDVLSRDGYVKASLGQIGRSIGMETAHILYYFASREELLQEVLRVWDARNLADAGSHAKLLGWWIEAVRRNVSNPGIVQLYTAFATEAADVDHPAHAFFQLRYASLQEFIAAEIKRKRRASGAGLALEPEVIAAMLISLSDGLQIRWLVDRSVDMAGTLQAAIDALVGAPTAHTE